MSDTSQTAPASSPSGQSTLTSGEGAEPDEAEAAPPPPDSTGEMSVAEAAAYLRVQPEENTPEAQTRARIACAIVAPVDLLPPGEDGSYDATISGTTEGWTCYFDRRWVGFSLNYPPEAGASGTPDCTGETSTAQTGHLFCTTTREDLVWVMDGNRTANRDQAFRQLAAHLRDLP